MKHRVVYVCIWSEQNWMMMMMMTGVFTVLYTVYSTHCTVLFNDKSLNVTVSDGIHCYNISATGLVTEPWQPLSSKWSRSMLAVIYDIY